jgi:hypothetical protein
MPKYKNVSNQKQVIPEVGEVEPGGTIESDRELLNSNLELVRETRPQQQPVQAINQPTQPHQQVAPTAPPAKTQETA